jgi:hypothetical protein
LKFLRNRKSIINLILFPPSPVPRRSFIDSEISLWRNGHSRK